VAKGSEVRVINKNKFYIQFKAHQYWYKWQDK